MNLQKYIGGRVELIYMDGAGKLTKRRVKILRATDTSVKAYDYTSDLTKSNIELALKTATGTKTIDISDKTLKGVKITDDKNGTGKDIEIKVNPGDTVWNETDYAQSLESILKRPRWRRVWFWWKALEYYEGKPMPDFTIDEVKMGYED